MGPCFGGRAAVVGVKSQVSDTEMVPGRVQSPRDWRPPGACSPGWTDRAGFPAGTEKVRQAQECGQLHVVNPDWLWSCLERWDRVEEQLFPLREDYGRVQR